MSRLVATAVVGAVLAAAVVAQEPKPQREAPLPAPPAEVERAGQLLRAHAARCKDVKVVLADFVQRRTTALVKEPLVSKGEFLFVREPAAVVFFAREPRLSTVRLTATTYEVYRPQKQQLERFFLDGPELATGLFAAVGGDAERLVRDFVVAACRDSADGATVAVRLVAKDEAVRARVAELIVTLHAKSGELASVAYRDGSGDLVEIELRALRIDPKSAPSAVLEVPAGTAIVEHAAASAKPAPPRR